MLFSQYKPYEDSSLLDLFLHRLPKLPFTVPQYQRGYEWPDRPEEQRVALFLKDFFDAVDTNHSHNHLGNFIFFHDKSTLSIIDGAQRLSTIFVFGYALCSYIVQMVASPENKLLLHRAYKIKKHILSKHNTIFYNNSKGNFDTAYKISLSLIQTHTSKKTGRQLSSYINNLLDTFENSKVNFVLSTDQETARNYFKILNTGKQISPYEHIKLILDSSGNSASIAALDSLFLKEGKKRQTPDLQELTSVISSKVTELYVDDTGSIITPGSLASLVLNNQFAEVFEDSNFISYVLSTKQHFNDTIKWINSIADDKLSIEHTHTKTLLYLMQHDIGFQKTKEEYIQLLLVAEALQCSIQNNKPSLSGTQWISLLSSYRQNLMTKNPLAFIELKSNLLAIYNKSYKISLLGAQSSALSDKNKQSFRLWLYLLEIYLNGNKLPPFGKYTLEHINAFNGTKKDNTIHNLCLLEESINKSLGAKVLSQKTSGYLSSKLNYVKHIANNTNIAQNIIPIANGNDNPYYADIWKLLDFSVTSILT